MNNDSTALMDVTQVAIMAGLHRSTVFKLVSAGKFPKPVKLGRSTRWLRGELVSWIDAKCPPLSKWDARKMTLKV